jgi:glycolate oxidase iron-sulfur subunit
MQNEAESPRGRIALVQGLASGQLMDSPGLQAHLDRCLGCRACERACPSGVRYAQLIDGARAQQARHRGRTQRLLHWLALGLLSSPRTLRIGAALLCLIPRRLRPALTYPMGSGIARRLGSLLPEVGRPIFRRRLYPAQGSSQGRVGLFTGCISQITGPGAQTATIRLLNRLGMEVAVPRHQGCCGALHQHGGAPGTARRLAHQNQAAFQGQGLEAIVSTASGCGAQLKEYDPLLDGGDLGAPVHDVSAYLCALPWPTGGLFRPLPKRVAVHDPCSLYHTPGATEAPYRLLERIPEIELMALPGNAFCCGAGGINLLTQPAMADGLRAPKLDALRSTGAEILVTSNSSCALHLAAGIREAGLTVEVLHPVELLARQLID